MSIFLLPNWKMMIKDICIKLESSKNSIDDLYPVLLRTHLEQLKSEDLENENSTLFNAINNIEIAIKEFYKLPLPPTEIDAVKIVEAYYNSLYESDEKLAEEYKNYLGSFLLQYNIRYCVCPPCKLSLTLAGLLSTQFDYIKYLSKITGPSSRMECIKILEKHSREIERSYEENHCIDDSIKLIEYFLYDKTKQSTLGEAVDHSDILFPHESVKNSIKNYYDFSNDYPNIRHIGSPKSAKRSLNKSDGILALSIAIAYSAFIIQNHEAILSGNYIKITGEEETDLFSIFGEIDGGQIS